MSRQPETPSQSPAPVDAVVPQTIVVEDTQDGNAAQAVYQAEAQPANEVTEVKCSKCHFAITPENMVAKSVRSQVLLRKGCHSTSVMMSRHFDEMPAAWDRFDEQEQVDFYRKILTKKNEGPLRFKVLRTELRDSLVKKVMEEKKKGFVGKFLPLESYRLQGFDCKRIEDMAERQEHPILGTTFRVDIHHISQDTIEQDVEESIRSVDKRVKRERLPQEPKAKAAKKGKKKNADEKENNEDDPIPPAQKDPILVDLMEMDEDSDIEVTFLTQRRDHKRHLIEIPKP